MTLGMWIRDEGVIHITLFFLFIELSEGKGALVMESIEVSLPGTGQGGEGW